MSLVVRRLLVRKSMLLRRSSTRTRTHRCLSACSEKPYSAGVSKCSSRNLCVFRETVFSRCIKMQFQESVHKGVLTCLCCTLPACQEINAAAEVIYENVDPSANIIFGALVDDRMQGELSITVLATGFQTEEEVRPFGLCCRHSDVCIAVALLWTGVDCIRLMLYGSVALGVAEGHIDPEQVVCASLRLNLTQPCPIVTVVLRRHMWMSYCVAAALV